jgi:hypothetical protein
VSSIRSRMRSRTSRYVVLALAAATLTVVGLDQATAAHALDGRRLCMYVDGEHNNSVWRFVVTNYKKSGRCPHVNQEAYPDLVTGDPNNVTKRTCEEVSAFVGYADDICRVLQADMLYELLFDERTMLPAERNLLGRVSEFA